MKISASAGIPNSETAVCLAVPFWSGNRNHPGDLAEIIAFDRVLEPGERQTVKRHLNRKYGLH